MEVGWLAGGARPRSATVTEFARVAAASCAQRATHAPAHRPPLLSTGSCRWVGPLLALTSRTPPNEPTCTFLDSPAASQHVPDDHSFCMFQVFSLVQEAGGAPARVPSLAAAQLRLAHVLPPLAAAAGCEGVLLSWLLAVLPHGRLLLRGGMLKWVCSSAAGLRHSNSPP